MINRLLALLLLLSALALAQNPNTAVYPTNIATDQDITVPMGAKETTLSAGISNSTLSIPVTDASGILDFSVITICDLSGGECATDIEDVLVCNVNVNTLEICAGGRGFGDTSGIAHDSGDAVRAFANRHPINQVAAEVKAIEGSLGPVTTVSGLGSLSPSDADMARVTDGADIDDCTTGGGTEPVLCIYDASAVAWEAVRGGTGGGGSGDAIEVEDGDNGGTFSGVDTTARFEDSEDIDFERVDGGAGGPDEITGKIRANSVNLGADTVGNFLSSCTNGTGITGCPAAAESASATPALDYSATLAGNPALSEGQCMFSSQNNGGIICESITADNVEGLFVFPLVTDVDTSHEITTNIVQQTLIKKTIDQGVATTTHAIQQNFLQHLRHATSCPSITDGKDGEFCWEKDSNSLWVCETSDGLCNTVGEWIQSAGGSAGNAIVDDTANATDNAVRKSVGTSGRETEESGVTIDDTDKVIAPGGFESTSTDPSNWQGLTDDVMPGAPGGSNEFNLGVNRTTGNLEVHRNGQASADVGGVAEAAFPVYIPSGGCDNATAGPVLDIPTSNGGAAACYGTSPQRFGGLDFADGAAALTSGFHHQLPAKWTGAVDIEFDWFSGSTSTNSAVWTVATACIADGEDLLAPTYNATQTVADANNATANTRNSASITGITMTGCAAGETLFVRVGRDPTNGSDTLAATAVLLGVELTIRRGL